MFEKKTVWMVVLAVLLTSGCLRNPTKLLESGKKYMAEGKFSPDESEMSPLLVSAKRQYDEVLAREFSDPLYFGGHRTTVDCYALQHPEGYCASFKSFAAHLTGLCCAVEFGKDRAIHVGLNGRRDETRPRFVDQRGAITIEAIHS